MGTVIGDCSCPAAEMNSEFWKIHSATYFIAFLYSLYLSYTYAHFLFGITFVLSPECLGSVTFTFSSMVSEH